MRAMFVEQNLDTLKLCLEGLKIERERCPELASG
jgi:hypothetical protein